MWKRLPDLSFNIVNHQTIIIDNVAYIIGGYKNSVILDFEKISVFIINLSDYTVNAVQCNTLTWNCKSNSINLSHIEPFDCYGHTVVKWRHLGVLFGGSLNQSHDYSPSKIYLFVPNWQCLPHRLKCHQNSSWKNYWIAIDGVEGNIPKERDGHSAVVLVDKMFIYGGLVGSETKYFDNKLYQLDFILWKWTIIYDGDSIEPLARDFSSLAVYKNGLYLFGGRSDDGINEVSNNDIYDTAVWRFDLSINKWYKIHPGYGIIFKSSMISNVNLNEQNSDQICNKIYKGIPFPRRSHMTVVFQNQLIVFGGLYETNNFNIHFCDLWSFDMSTNHWTALFDKNIPNFIAEKPQNLRRGSLTMINENFALLIGGVTDTYSNKYEGKLIGNCLIISGEEPMHKHYHSLSSLCGSTSFKTIPIVLYQKTTENFSGSISIINNLSLRSVNRVFILQLQLTLYQRCLHVVIKYYNSDQLSLPSLPHKIISDINILSSAIK